MNSESLHLARGRLTNAMICVWFALVVVVTTSHAQGDDFVVFAKNSNSLTTTFIIGKIVEMDTKIPLEFSAVTLHSIKDSVLLTGGVSDAEGVFEIETRDTDYFVKVEFIGYQPKIIDKIILDENRNKIDLGLIELEPTIELINEVEVFAEKSTVMMNLDKRVFNVGKDLKSIGGTAADVLRNVPGVSVDVDGNFTLRSSGGVRILLNSRATSLICEDNLSGLRQIQAYQIERIEVITNPSARYEAEGMVGIINIILKKNESKGLDGSINANVGSPDNFGIGAIINYSKNKFNGYIGNGNWYVDRPGLGSFRNEFYNLDNPNRITFSNMDRIHNRKSMVRSFNCGFDYFINTKNILSSSFTFRKRNGKNSSELLYEDAIHTRDNIVSITERLEKETQKETNLQYSLSYKKLFDKKGHQISTKFGYDNKMEHEVSIYNEISLDSSYNPLDSTDFDQFTNNDEGNQRFNLKVDYVLPVMEAGTFEAGIQSSYRMISNNYRVMEVVNEIESPNMSFTNDFRYQELIHGMFLNFGQKINKFSFQTGLRVEYSDVETKLLTTNTRNPRKYTNFFPSTFLTYDFPANNAVQLSYSRRIHRPTFPDLNPFYTLRDRRNIFRGNPNIEPEYTDSYEMGHIKYWEKASLGTTAYFRKTNNVIKRIQRVEEDSPEITITQAENLDIKKNYGVEFIYAYFPRKWWRLNGDINFFHSLSEGHFEHEGKLVFVGGESFSMTSKINTRFTFWKKINTQLGFSYSAPRTTTQGVNRETASVDFTVGMDVFKKNGSMTLAINDVFNSRRRRSFSEDDSFYSEDNFLWQSRAVVLSFSYRFNQQKARHRIYSNILKDDDDNDNNEF